MVLGQERSSHTTDQSKPLGNIFTCVFEVPFRREDVFREVCVHHVEARETKDPTVSSLPRCPDCVVRVWQLCKCRTPLGVSTAKLQISTTQSWQEKREINEYQRGCIRQVDCVERAWERMQEHLGGVHVRCTRGTVANSPRLLSGRRAPRGVGAGDSLTPSYISLPRACGHRSSSSRQRA